MSHHTRTAPVVRPHRITTTHLVIVIGTWAKQTINHLQGAKKGNWTMWKVTHHQVENNLEPGRCQWNHL
jgi:hypothetical protein